MNKTDFRFWDSVNEGPESSIYDYEVAKIKVNMRLQNPKTENRKPTLTLLGESDKVAYRLGKQ